jgi:phosphohistidine phosphatase SixA
MGLLLVRHADAVEGGGEIDDAARWLSAEGRARARKVGAALAEKGLIFTKFVTSPRVRAVQTAEIFAFELDFPGPIEVIPALSFTMPAARAREALARLGGNVAAFGHMPTIGELCTMLAPQASSSFAASEAVFLEDGQVRFRLDPASLR